LKKIPHLPQDKAEPLHQAAQQSVGSLSGAIGETLVRDLVAQVRHCQHAEQKMRQLLTSAFADLPASGYQQLVTIPGIGEATAAVLAAKIVDIDRFETPADLVGYFGVFPEEDSSGVDKHGNPLPPGTLCMSRKGNDLVRHYLWNAARVGIRFNPALRALYARLKAKGKRGDVIVVVGRKGTHNGQLIGDASRARQQFTKADARHIGGDRLEETADLRWSIRLGIKSLVLRGPSLQPQKDHVPGPAKSGSLQVLRQPGDHRGGFAGLCLGMEKLRERKTQNAKPADIQPFSPANSVTEYRWPRFEAEHGFTHWPFEDSRHDTAMLTGMQTVRL
jgi:hypothetical protein